MGLVQASLLDLFEEWTRGLDESEADRLDFNSEDSDVSVDVNAFYLVMDQVFDNGLRHEMDGQMITVGLHVSDAEVVSVCVTSLGDEPPQSPEILQSWKDPFRRGALHLRGRSAEGAGLGLAAGESTGRSVVRQSDLGSDCLRRPNDDKVCIYVE